LADSRTMLKLPSRKEYGASVQRIVALCSISGLTGRKQNCTHLTSWLW